ncbi:MAG: ACP S-malonyltransferase [Chloroflexi bacterium]|nr:ACP S-malonyltransferase [Chloroflexota bacterium]
MLFPGQASQAVGMGTDLREHSAHARDLFARADAITGRPVSKLCAEGPLEQLTATDIAQPAVVAASLAALAVLHAKLDLNPVAVAGHSVGEFAACVAADVLDEEAALQLVHVRAQAMAAACTAVDGTMAAVIGLDEDAVRAACTDAARADSMVEIANLNAPGQTVVSGARDAILRLGQVALARGARRMLPLNVGGPFHSVYMRPAAAALARALEQTQFRQANVPVVLNASAQASHEPGELRRELEVQVYSPVRWVATLQRLADLGCDRFLEVGPGQVLSGLVRRTLPRARVASFGALADLPNTRALLKVAVV